MKERWVRVAAGTAGIVLAILLIMVSGNSKPAFAAAASPGSKPAFDGKTLSGWHQQGEASWKVDQGEIVGAVRGVSGGWLVLNDSYEEVGVAFWFRCNGDCQTGILLGMQTAGDRTTGTYLSLAEGGLGRYEMTLDGQGREISRQKPAPAPAPARQGDRATPSAAALVRFPDPPNHPYATETLEPHVNPNGWNEVEVHMMDGSLFAYLNGHRINTGRSGPDAESQYGPIAIRVAGKPGAEVRLKDVKIADYTEFAFREDKASSRFRMQRLTPFFFGDGVGVADLNRDGYLDLVSGPMYFLGPDYKVAREIDEARPLDPIHTRAPLSVGVEVADFTGDGWPDVLMSDYPPHGFPGYLYVNPRGERRRWKKYEVISAVDSEVFTLADIDGDGKPEFVYGEYGYVSYAKPDPANPTKPWVVHHLSEQGPWAQSGSHGLGAGDINGDGRLDVLNAWGWWEHPAQDTGQKWAFHPVKFGRRGTMASPGGGQIYVYDVNGDGLPDVITSLEGHGVGLAWYEQKRDSNGQISFVQHMIMDRNPAESHGVVFSELHSLALADVDGDGLKDIIAGKNKSDWAHNSFGQIDSEGEAVLYWFKLVRKPGGQVEFLPHLVNNNSGASRQIQAVDINGDGTVDLIVNGKVGTFIFYGKKNATD
jgi:3-keto-disaccharide hydrolase/FG-GAP-like repeat